MRSTYHYLSHYRQITENEVLTVFLVEPKGYRAIGFHPMWSYEVDKTLPLKIEESPLV